MRLSKILGLTEAAEFIGSCDRFRKKCLANERLWHKLMADKIEISEEEFLQMVDISGVLDEGETWEEYKSALQKDLKFYKTDKYYFFQHAGFEFLFKEKQ